MTLNLDILDNVNGEENRIVFYTEESSIENLTEDEFELLENFDLYINGSNNTVKIKIKDRKDIESFLRREGLYITITGNNNNVDLGLIKYNTNPLLNMTGLLISVGENFINPNYASNCNLTIDDGNEFDGTRIYLQDNNSTVTIGKNCKFSSGTDVWCTDAYTVFDVDGNAINQGKSIEIQDYVWIGKDAKIGKNTKISKHSVVQWSSVVTEKFEESNVIIEGNPAKIIKKEINWSL